ncbi:hypothetical protein WA158_003671 [Blastocystis sp. Blastoise]
MNNHLIAIFLLFTSVLGLNHQNAYYSAHFDSYLTRFNRQYTKSEYQYRLSVFSKNLDFIESENSKNHHYTLGLTRFADMTHDEFKSSKICGCYIKPNFKQASSIQQTIPEFLPESIDWREKGAVNPIKDQSTCGACWAFSALASIETAVFLSVNTLFSLSEQQLIDCDTKNHGCSGGNMILAYRYVLEHGICSDEQYPYESKDGECKSSKCKSVAIIKNYETLDSGKGKQLYAALSEHVVSVGIDADSDLFQHYVSGIIDSEDCGTDLDHGVAAVGYGKENGIQYIIIRNSWGTEWGENGYAKIAYIEEGAGICGINQANSVAMA